MGLGDYIHFRYSNYKRYGVNMREPAQTSYATNVMQQRLATVQDIKNTQTIAILKKRLQQNTSTNLSKEQAQWQQKQQQYINQIYTILYNQSNNVKGIKRVGQVASGHYYSTKDGSLIKHAHGAHWAPTLSHSELMNRRKAAQAQLRKINALITDINTTSDISTIDSKLNQLVQYYEKYTSLSPYQEENQHVAGAIEKAIGESTYSGVTNQVAGLFGEMLVATCDDQLWNLGNKTVAQAVSEFVKGSERTSIYIDKTAFSDQAGKVYNKTSEDGTQYYLGTTQNKVDVQITINNEPLFASVKSYAIEDPHRSHVDLQDVNLLPALTFLDTFDKIGTHWINMHVSNAIGNSDSLDQIVKQEVAFQALSSGNPFKQGTNNANVFVYINRATGQVYIKSVKQILSNLSSFSSLDKINSLRFDNSWDNSSFDNRIARIINHIHGINLSIGLNINFA